MTLWKKIQELFTIDDYYMDETFSLGDRPIAQAGEGEQQKAPDGDQGQMKDQGQEEDQAKNKQDKVLVEPNKHVEKGGFTKPVKPIKVNEFKEKHGKIELDVHSDEVYHSLELNLQKIKARFGIPPNVDIIIREFLLSLDVPRRGAVVFMEGLAARDIINSHILLPLMLLAQKKSDDLDQDPITVLMDSLLPGNQVEEKDAFTDLIQGIMSGTTLVLVDGYNKGLLVETKGWEHRTVSRPLVENVVRGPQEAFVEHFRVNTALIRKRLRSDNLITEGFKIGKLSNTDCAIMYLRDVANPKLVEEVRRRIKAIKTDYVTDSGVVEKLIEDNPASLVPGQMYTERPDRVAAQLAEGQVAVIVDGDPFVLIVPTTFWSLIHAAEDVYVRWPFATFFRAIRILAMLITLYLPSFYISIVNYHPEMIPTDLLLAMAASREQIPFPAIWEVLLMEISFELIREAGIRIPNIIGPTLGIVGALILGQAAVAANIVSPLLVIIVAVTGLGSFAIPNYSLGMTVRALRFFFLFLAAVLGFYGLAIGVFIVVINMCGQKSFGVPVMSPVAPYRGPSPDVVVRQPEWHQEKRPEFMRTPITKRQPEITRSWDPMVGQYLEDSKEGKRNSKGKNRNGRRGGKNNGGD